MIPDRYVHKDENMHGKEEGLRGECAQSEGVKIGGAVEVNKDRIIKDLQVIRL